MKRILFLFSPDPIEGGTPAPTENNPAPAPAEPAAPPPAATTVLQGTKTERELDLEKKLRDREIELSHIQDENHRLKQVPTAAPAAAAPAEEDDDWTAFPVK
jgi:hypothetical protein